MEYIEYFSDFVKSCLGIMLLIFLLMLIDSLIRYFRVKTDLINRQIDEYDFNHSKNE